ncbi:MFS transporter [Mycolicibacterium wolinskyi]|uniref:Multidrug efflux pump Tap n=1 Tax=Mycolicibacterium wolinskyi TaxID=59750 RepID=A0A1X2F9U5_9MYCO|nr:MULTISPECIES: MFS transporter [Mycolicibacterium]MCV7290484.1 MFS transporter [Mycolicibacterium wolinskyi]MCV7297044.1 MFS transporter [Mycolicibacterium goodii]ORX15196.1 MFS transporter permease [Mycolicibacterium wolinskyi]
MRGFFADTTPLRSPDFRRLWLAGIPTVIGANLTIFAVPVQLYALTQNSAYVGLSGLFALVPLIVFGLWGGAWADAMDRRLLLIIASIGLAVSSVLLWVQAAAGLDNVWVVLCLLSVQQAFYAINSPTRSAAIPRMVPGEQLPAANSLNMTVMQFGAIVGPLLAGLLLSWVDLSTLYLIDAITCLAPIWATVRLAPMPPTSTEQGSARWGLTAVLDGFRYLAGNRVVLMSFVVDLIAMIFGMPRALFPQMAHESFGGPVEGGTVMALLAAAMSAGAVLGGVFSGWLPRIRRQGLAVVVAIVAWGVAMVGFGLAGGLAGGTAGTFLWIALAFLAIGGAADMVSAAFRSTILQQAASDELRGRLQGVFTVVVAGGPRLADTLHGAAAAAVGTTVAAAGGGALVVVGVVIAALVVPAFVRYRVAGFAARDDQSEPDKV